MAAAQRSRGRRLDRRVLASSRVRSDSAGSISISQPGAGGPLERRRQRAIFLAGSAADLRDPRQMILRLIAVALLDLPETIILPGQHMVRIGLQCALVPDLRKPVIAELAVGVADQICHIGKVVVTQRLELRDGGSVIVAFIDRGIGRAITLDEGGIFEKRLLGLLALVCGAGRGGGLAAGRLRRLAGHDIPGILPASTSTAPSAAGAEGWNSGKECE